MWLSRNYKYTIKSILKFSSISSVSPSNSSLKNTLKKESNLVIPQKLSTKKHKYSEQIYINNLEAADIIAKNILNDIPKNTTFLEINPGNGFLTSFFLNNDNVSKLLLYETYSEFLPKFEELHLMYPDRIIVKHGDFINLWKIAFRDKFDNETRLQDLLDCIPKKKFSDDINMKVFGGVGSRHFFNHLINNLVFDSSIYSYGRCEMYLIIPPKMYIHLTCNREAGYTEYRSTSVLFQIMFEYKFICKIPKIYFLPPIFESSKSKRIKNKKLVDIENDFLYLIKIVPRKNIYDICPLEDMPALLYFIKQSFVSRKTRVIPNMEKWVPGCGPRMIINSKPRISPKKLFEDEIDQPKLSVPCTTMSTNDYYPSLNIFTQFGELSPSHILSLFIKFRNWPEYKHSPFLASLENYLIKMEGNEDNVDEIKLIEEDDCTTTKSDVPTVSKEGKKTLVVK